MRLSDWAERLAPALRGAGATLPDRSEPAAWFGLVPEARAFVLAGQIRDAGRKTLILTGTYDKALAWQAKLELAGIPKGCIHQLPGGSSSLFEDGSHEQISASDRLGSLRALAGDGADIVIASPQAALERTLPRETLLESFLEVTVGQELDIPKFARTLTNLGYERQEPVRLPGGFSVRGGILDVFPTGYDSPLRIELFGDEIESIRAFDPNTQRSTGPVPALRLAPSRETLYAHMDPALPDEIRGYAEREATTLEPDHAEKLLEAVAEDADRLAERAYFDRLDLYRPYLHPDSGCAIDLLPEDGLLVLDEPLELEAIALRAETELESALKSRAARGEILASAVGDYTFSADKLGGHGGLALSSMNALPEWFSPRTTAELDTSSLEPYRGRPDAFAETLKNWLARGLTVVFGTDQPNRARTVLKGLEVHPFESPTEDHDGKTATYLAAGNLAGGFVMTALKTAFVTDAELFGVARLRLPQKRFLEGTPVATVLDLKPGDYVVHINFGIGVFRGLVKKEVAGTEREFLYLDYAAPDKLFVPADQLDRIQKYLNPADGDPKLNRLTGGEWQRTLAKAKEEARAFARDLVKVYAKRKEVTRRPYGPDTPFQQEMEGTFPWVETPGQMQAIRDAKEDMQAPYPMDRLVCGDVGFGKTEVAIRAAFKAVQDGRQVAILCPTTILSEQHHRNFTERLGSFGTKIGLVNRFVSGAEKRAALEGVKSGDTEILVGTHSLLGQGVDFKDLGLVVIDEEQKFGVKQKEMLKGLRTEVDVLTMSATPIPRTLSMALMDIRQMSLINDPPPGRLPVRTFVRQYANEVVRDAILREMARGGQVFYVYNRVDTIGHVAERIRSLVPSARIGVGHGQMNDKEIEPIMVGFVKGEIDVLLSTTIVENGIDISNANTLIVENADRLGLSQLYQLRGRVGRSDRQAYAYFLYSRGFGESVMQVNEAQDYSQGRKERTKIKAGMNENAMARLAALKEFSDLGAGYSLAFRDLQIRGAGELLGAKQSGTMANVGYELYTQLINEAVAALKAGVDGEEPEDDKRDPLESLEPLPSFEVPVVAMIPPTYITDPAQRLYYYQRMMSSREEGALGDAQSEIEDRYGRMPLEVSQAFAVLSLRIQGKALGIESLDARNGRVALKFRRSAEVSPRVFTMLQRGNRDAYVSKDAFIWPYSGAPVPAIDRLLKSLESAMAEIEKHREALGV